MKVPRPPSHPTEPRNDKPTSLGPNVVISGENASEYDSLLRRLLNEEKPFDFVDELLVKDVADNQWELQRLRRLHANAFEVIKPTAIAKLLGLHTEEFNDEYVRKDGTQFKWFQHKLESGAITDDLIMACGLLLHSSFFESLDRRMAAAEIRRGQALDRLQERRQHRSDVVQAKQQRALPEPDQPPINKS